MSAIAERRRHIRELRQKLHKELSLLEKEEAKLGYGQSVGYVYTRVSTNRQAEEGHSIRELLAKGVQYAEMKGIPLGDEREIPMPNGEPAPLRENVLYDDGVSGSHTDLFERPAGAKLIELLGRGDHIILPMLSRGFRSLADGLRTMDSWDRMGVSVHILDLDVNTSTPAGKMALQVLLAFSELESNQRKVYATEQHARRKRDSGLDPRKSIVGYRTNKNGNPPLVPCHKFRAYSRLFYRWYNEFGLAMDKIRSRCWKLRILNWRCKPPTTWSTSVIFKYIHAEEAFRAQERSLGYPLVDFRKADEWLCKKMNVDNPTNLDP